MGNRVFRRRPPNPDVLSTGQAANVCRCSIQTIIRLFDEGAIVGYKIPGSRFRKIPKENLYEFMKANGIPIRDAEGAANPGAANG